VTGSTCITCDSIETRNIGNSGTKEITYHRKFDLGFKKRPKNLTVPKHSQSGQKWSESVSDFPSGPGEALVVWCLPASVDPSANAAHMWRW
jgi:hypothetical protein